MAHTCMTTQRSRFGGPLPRGPPERVVSFHSDLVLFPAKRVSPPGHILRVHSRRSTGHTKAPPPSEEASVALLPCKISVCNLQTVQGILSNRLIVEDFTHYQPETFIFIRRSIMHDRVINNRLAMFYNARCGYRLGIWS
jgi:hypothetical protein